MPAHARRSTLLTAPPCPQVYALRRLARGLASGRDAARQGYATALAGVLGATSAVAAPGALVLLEACCEGTLKGGVRRAGQEGTCVLACIMQVACAKHGLSEVLSYAQYDCAY